MSNRTRILGFLQWLVSTIVPLVILGLGISGMYALANRKAHSPVDSGGLLPPLVKTIELFRSPESLDLTADGVVVPYREVTLAAEVSGKIISKPENCRAGRFVAQGSTLFEIDPRDYRLEVERLEQQLAQAGANLADLAVELANTESLIESANEEWALQKDELKRVENLRRALTDTEVDRVKRAEWTSRNNLLTLRNQIQLFRSRQRGLENARGLVATQLERAKLDLERTVVRAPVSGIIVRDHVEQDSYVQKGSELLSIEDTSRIEVKFSLQMEDLAWIWGQNTASSSSDGTAAKARSDDRAAQHYELPPTPVTVIYQPVGSTVRHKWRGELSRLDGLGLDERTRTAPCRAVLSMAQDAVVEGDLRQARGPRALLRGMFVKVLVHAQPDSLFLKLPEMALQPGKYVICVRDRRLTRLGPVTLARQMDESSGSVSRRSFLIPEGSGGIQAGDHIVISPLVAVTPGMQVREELQPPEGSEAPNASAPNLTTVRPNVENGTP